MAATRLHPWRTITVDDAYRRGVHAAASGKSGEPPYRDAKAAAAYQRGFEAEKFKKKPEPKK